MPMMRVEFTLPSSPIAACNILTSELLSGAGGYTVVGGDGAWVDAEGAGVYEDVRVITCYMEDDADNRLWVEALARKYKADAEQEAVLYVINANEFNLIED